MPVITGDRIDTARGARVEVQLADGSTLWIDEFTTLDFDALAASRENPAQRTVLFLQDGTAAIEVPASALGEDTLRFDYPHGSLFLSRPGLYRFDLRSGKLHVEAHAGLAELTGRHRLGSPADRAGGMAGRSGPGRGSRTRRPDRRLLGVGAGAPAPGAGGRTAEVVGSPTSGRTAALDSYGNWVYLDTRSTWAWRPYVQAGWSPYRHGRWYWTPVGWNWISYEPWGWYPYHYGSWYWDVSAGWLWCWDMVWGPAWVHWIYTPGYIGWSPRGYYDWWYHDHGYHNRGGHAGGAFPGGPGRSNPGRWSEVAFDFSGHVRLRDVDPRPWNMVPSNQFTNHRLDRVRVEPGRVLAEAGEGSRGYVRSGPLVTAPSRGEVERDFDSGFRGRPGSAGGDDLGTIFRRDEQSVRDIPAGSPVRAVRTADLVAGAPRRAGTSGDRGGTPAVDERISAPGRRPMVDLSGSPRSPRPAASAPSGSTGASPATGGTRSGRDSGGTGTTVPGRSEGTAPSRSAPAREPASSPPAAAPARGRHLIDCTALACGPTGAERQLERTGAGLTAAAQARLRIPCQVVRRAPRRGRALDGGRRDGVPGLPAHLRGAVRRRPADHPRELARPRDRRQPTGRSRRHDAGEPIARLVRVSLPRSRPEFQRAGEQSARIPAAAVCKPQRVAEPQLPGGAVRGELASQRVGAGGFLVATFGAGLRRVDPLIGRIVVGGLETLGAALRRTGLRAEVVQVRRSCVASPND